LSLYTGLACIWRSSKRAWIADFVAIRRTCAHLAYLETTLDCDFCSLYTVLPGARLGSKSSWMADIAAVRRTPTHLAFFDMTFDCRLCVAICNAPGRSAQFEIILDSRCCRYTQESCAFGLLRHELGLQILSLPQKAPESSRDPGEPQIVLECCICICMEMCTRHLVPALHLFSINIT
jgi:hypothetical protein